MHIPDWEKLFEPLKGRPNLRFLEIGSHEGRSALWLLENVLTAGNSTITCVDPHSQDGEYGRTFMQHAQEHFIGNIDQYKFKVRYLNIRSTDAWAHLGRRHYFDFIYVDGDHSAHACLHDCVLAVEHLKPDGFFLVDDYIETHSRVIKGFDAFATAYSEVVDHELIGTQQKVTMKPCASP